MERTIVYENKRLTCIGNDHTRIPAVLAKLHGDDVECLDVSHNKLISLQGIDQFPNITELIVDNNLLTEAIVLPRLAFLHTLSINNNKIQNLEIFLQKIVGSLPKLRYLSLHGNPACPDQLSDASFDEEDYARYRCYVLHHLPKLDFLDSSPVKAFEVAEARKRGHLLKVAKPTFHKDTEAGSPIAGNGFTPLPRSRREIGDHQGAYGKCRYKYSGKHSEGNRFIKNSDL